MSIPLPPQFEEFSVEYAYKPVESIARTQMESGVARQRQRFTEVPSDVVLKWKLTSYRLGIFESWYVHKAKRGAEWIRIPLINGLGTNEVETRFLGEPSVSTTDGINFLITARLEAILPVLSEGALDIILSTDEDGDYQEGTADLFEAIDRFHYLVHTTMPKTLA